MTPFTRGSRNGPKPPTSGTTVCRFTLSPAAAAHIRREMAALGADYGDKAARDAFVSDAILAPDDPRVIATTTTVTPARLAPWIEQAASQCFDPEVKRALEALALYLSSK